VPQGHDGAVEFRGKAQTQKGFAGNAKFHNDLVGGLESCRTADKYVAHARKVFEEFIWNGSEPPDGELHTEAEIRQLNKQAATMNELAEAQRKAYGKALERFKELEGRFSQMIQR
jgi:hypothetical protein